MIPMFDASSLQRASPSRPANPCAVIVKRAKTATTPTRDPISGRRKMCETTPTRATRSSIGAAGGFAVAACWAMSGTGGGTGSRPAAESQALAGALPRERDHLRRVRLVDEPRAGQDGLAAAHGVRVRVVEIEEHDRQVALQVLLLVDREQDLPRLDRLQQVGREVEASHLRRRLDALGRLVCGVADLRVQTQDRVDRLVRLQLRADLVLRRREILHPRHLQPHHVAAERLLRSAEALFEPDVPLLVDEDQELLHTLRLEPRARALTGDDLVLADMRDRAEPAEVLLAGVERDHGDILLLGTLERICDRARVRNGGGDPRGLA